MQNKNKIKSNLNYYWSYWPSLAGLKSNSGSNLTDGAGGGANDDEIVPIVDVEVCEPTVAAIYVLPIADDGVENGVVSVPEYFVANDGPITGGEEIAVGAANGGCFFCCSSVLLPTGSIVFEVFIVDTFVGSNILTSAPVRDAIFLLSIANSFDVDRLVVISITCPGIDCWFENDLKLVGCWRYKGGFDEGTE